ncbi:MAG: hypothetical protein AUH37_01960 [Candidatus Nitrososphaera sp. 13_1_40CM_48_12]|nr:MAG: hypothetical protein AUH37_01960 [Candidatus Nitrososphaera sp. 13_1_40CM_48_12]
MDDFVGKPFSIEEITDMIRKFAQEQRAKRHLTAMPKAISQTICPQYRKNRKQSEASCLPGLSWCYATGFMICDKTTYRHLYDVWWKYDCEKIQ